MNEDLELAALASGAVAGLNPKTTRLLKPEGNCDVAQITDDQGRSWICRRPLDTHAGLAIENEAGFLSVLTGEGLPFEVPRPAGFASLPQGGRAIVYPHIEGEPPYFYDADPGSGLLDQIARSIAAIHELPRSLAERVNLPVYTSSTYRERRITTLNLAEQTGKVPDTLATRWRRLFHDVEFWQFTPTITHNALTTGTLLVKGDHVNAITHWTATQVADPCDDLAWLIGHLSYEAAQYFFERYVARRNPESVDENMWERANLISEMAPMQQLLSAVRAQDTTREQFAVVMLVDLEEALAESVRRQAEYDLETTMQQGDAISRGLPFAIGDKEPGGFMTGGMHVMNPHSANTTGAVNELGTGQQADANSAAGRQSTTDGDRPWLVSPVLGGNPGEPGSDSSEIVQSQNPSRAEPTAAEPGDTESGYIPRARRTPGSAPLSDSELNWSDNAPDTYSTTHETEQLDLSPAHNARSGTLTPDAADTGVEFVLRDEPAPPRYQVAYSVTGSHTIPTSGADPSVNDESAHIAAVQNGSTLNSAAQDHYVAEAEVTYNDSDKFDGETPDNDALPATDVLPAMPRVPKDDA